MHRNATYTPIIMRKRRALETQGIQAADAVITVSESIADHLAGDYKIARPHRRSQLPGFQRVCAGAPARPGRPGPLPETPLAVYVGSVTVNRGIEYAVRALRHYPEPHFVTVGPARPQTREQMLALAQQIGVGARFHAGSRRAERSRERIGSADVSVLPIQNVCLSYYRMPNKLLESVFAGIPVAVASLFELKKFVAAHQVGLVMDETDPQSIAAAIQALVAGPGRLCAGRRPEAGHRRRLWLGRAGGEIAGHLCRAGALSCSA